MSEVVWSVNIMIAILLISVGIVLYYIFQYDNWYPNGSDETPKQEELLQLQRLIVFLTAILLMSPLILGLTYSRKKELELQELIRQRKEQETWKRRHWE